MPPLIEAADSRNLAPARVTKARTPAIATMTKDIDRRLSLMPSTAWKPAPQYIAAKPVRCAKIVPTEGNSKSFLDPFSV